VSQSVNKSRNKVFECWRGRRDGGTYADLIFYGCTFDNCALALNPNPEARTRINNVHLLDCVDVNSSIGPAILEDVTVNGLKVRGDLLILWGTLFKHVTLQGHVGSVKINASALCARDDKAEEPFTRFRNTFYEQTDWALDLREGEFGTFEIAGIPARLIRRDPATQAVVTREKAMRRGWRKKVHPANTFWPFVIDLFLQDGEPDIVLVAGKRHKKSRQLRDGLQNLRDLGVAEPD
jgi:hypothetical protein